MSLQAEDSVDVVVMSTMCEDTLHIEKVMSASVQRYSFRLWSETFATVANNRVYLRPKLRQLSGVHNAAMV